MTHSKAPATYWAILAFAAFVCAMAIVSSCQGCGQGEAADTLRMKKLRALDDSVAQLSPKARELIESGMQEAADSLEYFEYSLRLARLFVTESKTDSAKRQIHRAMTYLERQKPTPRTEGILGIAYNTAGVASHNFHQDTENTKRFYAESYRHIMQSDAKDMAPDVCANLADAYMFDNDLPQAASWYRRALFLVDSLQLDKTRNTSLYMGLAVVYLTLEDYGSALRNLEECEKYFSAMRPEMQVYLVTTFGNYYYYTKQYGQSQKQFERLEKLLLKNNMQHTFAWYACKLNMSDVLLNLGKTGRAKAALDEAERYFKEHGDDVATYYARSIKLGIALRTGDMQTAAGIAADNCNRAGIMSGLVDIRNRYLQEYYEKTGDYRSAYLNLRTEKQKNDSLVHARQHMIAAEIISRFAQDTLQLHHEIEMQHKETDMEQARYTIAGSVAALVVLTLAIICGVTYWRKKLIQEKIRILKLKMENARNRISPHFVFNVLNNRITSTQGPDEANELLLLAKLIRTNLDMSGRETVTVAEEMEFVDNYVAIEQRTIQGGITYGKDVAQGITAQKLSSFRIPSLCIQILVENSIKHALKGKNGEKRLSIRFEACGDGIAITVADNGAGFDIRRCHSLGQGLTILRTTINAINQRNKKKIRFNITNTTGNEGNTTGCEATICFPESVKEI